MAEDYPTDATLNDGARAAKSAQRTDKLSLQDGFLEALRKQRTSVSVYLVNGIKLKGRVSSLDKYVVMLDSGQSKQLVYKHAISTVVPDTEFNF